MFEAVRAMKSAETVGAAAGPVWRGAVLISAALLLGGCVTGVGYGSPSFYAEVSSAGGIYQAPPPLPDYAQPPCPGDGYLWVPGYWAYSAGYYWVPGAWVLPPQVGLLWTPGYWGFAGGAYVWHAGYWGPHVGFYGGVHYGFGYDGDGYVGGRWEGRHFLYNRDVTNVRENVVHDTYFERVHRAGIADRVSYNGGRGGIIAHPTREDRRFAHEPHVRATSLQREHDRQSARNPTLFARENRGRPPVATMPHPGHFQGRGVQPARGADRFPRQVARPNDRARPNFPERPDHPSRRNVGSHPSVQTRPSAPRPDFQARADVRARPGLRSQPTSQPTYQAHRNVPERPGYPSRQNVGSHPSVQTRASAPRPNFQARADVRARPGSRSQPALQPTYQAHRNVPERPTYPGRPGLRGKRPGPQAQSGARPGPRRGKARPPHGRRMPAKDRRHSDRLQP